MKLIAALMTLLLPACCLGQISVDTSYQSLALRLPTDDGYRVLTFRKENDSENYTSMRYYVGSSTGEQALSSEVLHIKNLWDSAAKLVKMELTSINVGYPLEYNDVLRKHVAAFNTSAAWQDHVKKNGRTLNYPLMRRVMRDGQVYSALEEVMKGFGYELVDFSTEKHGFLTTKQLEDLGENPKSVVPVPFIVYVKVKKM